jgi:hypothetical protein
MRHTFYGDMAGRFDGSGTSLFLRGIVLWLILVLPVVAALLSQSAADWTSFADQVVQNANRKTGVPIVAGSVDKVLLFTPLWIVFVGLLLFPAFEAMTVRWWLSGVRFGEVAVTSSLRTIRVYGIYARCLGVSIVFIIVALVLAMISAGVFMVAFFLLKLATVTQIMGTVFGVIFYIVILIALSVIYQLVVKLALWRAMLDSLDISNFHLVDRVKAEGQQSSPFGEGLADALHVGNF